MKMKMIAALLVAVAGAAVQAEAGMVAVVPITAANNQEALRASMRKLWADHVVWTREFIVAELGSSAEADDVATRLLKNQAEIGESLDPYYGKEAGERMTALLKQHILIAAEVLEAAKTGNDGHFRDANARWHDNAGELAVFLNGLNPLLSKKALHDMLDDHLALTTKEAVSQIDKNWGEDIASFDKLFGQMMMMADDISGGIIKQFPEKF